MSAQDWVYGLIVYFVGIFIVFTLFSIAGVFNQGEINVQGGYNPILKGSTNYSELPTGVTSTFSIGKYFKDVFSFFIFNISIGTDDSILYQYFWIFRVIFVYIPVTFLVLAIWYSMPTVSS
jgi:hypothetical protein